MGPRSCIICGSKSDMVWHHVIPKKVTGMSLSDQVPLCVDCHHKEFHNQFLPKHEKEISKPERDHPRLFLKFMDEKRKRLQEDFTDAKEIKDPEKRLGAEMELHYCRVQAQEGASLHNQIEKSLGKLKKLGLHQKKIQELENWFK